MPDGTTDTASLIMDAARLGVTLTGSQAGALLEFRDLLTHWNRAFNLVSRRDQGRVVARHLLDSLSVAPDLTGNEVLDLGTGAGLPGVPLAIALQRVQFTLVDRNARRIRFVERTVRQLGLGNVAARCADVRELPAAAFDTVVCRAVAEVDVAWALAAARLRPRGRLVIMHRGQGMVAPTTVPLPSEVRIQERRAVQIPGLERAHEVVILTRAEAADGASESTRGRT